MDARLRRMIWRQLRQNPSCARIAGAKVDNSATVVAVGESRAGAYEGSRFREDLWRLLRRTVGLHFVGCGGGLL